MTTLFRAGFAIAIAITALSCPPATVAQSGESAAPAPGKMLVERDARVDLTGWRLLEDYGGFALYGDVDGTAVRSGRRQGVRMLDRADILEFSAGAIDTRRGAGSAPAPFDLAASDAPGLHVVQFIGPVRSAWLDELSAAGIVPVHYVANHGYLVWVEKAAADDLAQLRGQRHWLQFSAPLHPHLKIDPLLQAHLDADAAGEEAIDVIVQVYRHPGAAPTRAFVEALAQVPVSRQAPVGPGNAELDWYPVLAFENLELRVRIADLPVIARRADVTFIGQTLSMQLLDERQGIVMTGDFSPGAASIDYLQFLSDLGFSEEPEAYPIVDVTDTPVHEGGTGVTVLDTVDAKLRVAGLASGDSRVVAFTNCSLQPDDQIGDEHGHGSINAGIVAGFDQRAGWPYQDDAGHQLGLGINPFARIGSTALFSPGFSLAGCGGSHAGLIRHNWDSGARISNNAWGSSTPPATYEASQQAYDAGVRDADPDSEFNQQMIYVFSAGNLGMMGTGTVASPGAAKNVITVGASENVRPDWTDGCNAGPDMADNANDVAPFSSRGPSPGGRTKPETIAPGTHVQGGASNYVGYNGQGVCDTFHPPGQTEFASSSGTSHSAPAVAAVASLAWWWIEQGGAGAAAGSVDRIERVDAPSPALMKAWLMAHPIYLDGEASGDDLPSPAQGYGMPDIRTMFDTTPKVLVDQSEMFVETGETLTYRWGVADPALPVRVALAYTDAPGALGVSPQVNDLDLKVAFGGQTWLGNRFQGAWSAAGGEPDALNNYEAVFLPAGTVDDVLITITASNVAADAVNAGGGPSQDFALVCYNCQRSPGFSLDVGQTDLHACAGGESTTTIGLASIAGFDGAVTLSAEGSLPGFGSQFLPNPVVPDATAIFRYSAPAGAVIGLYDVTLTGSHGELEKSRDFSLQVYDVAPAATQLQTPANGETAVDSRPAFTWTAQPHALDYRVEIAADPGFTQLVLSTETRETSWTPDSRDALDSSRRYWWRVVVRNPCGDSASLAPPADTVFRSGFEATPAFDDAYSFVTEAMALDCPVDVDPVVVFADDLEGDVSGWSTAAADDSLDLWRLGASARSGEWAWQATAPEVGSGNDQWLVSPSIVLPADLDNLRAQFWQHNNFKSGANDSCQDGGVVEVSTNQGTTWLPVNDGVYGLPYDGPVSGAFNNPLAGRRAWCGDPRAYTRSVVDLGDYAGHVVKLRFRAGHDRFAHRRGVNWAIDDILVRGCPQP